VPFFINQGEIPNLSIPPILNAMADTGPQYVPWDVKRLRMSSQTTLRRLGAPLLYRHRYSDLDVREGRAIKIGTMDQDYLQPRYNDPLSIGSGYASVELSPNEWYDSAGQIYISNINPGPGYTQAPLYRGYGRGHLIYAILPDRTEDYFKANLGGPLMKIQEATIIAPWFPRIWDGDLLIEVILDKGSNIISREDIYEAKNVRPITMRGHDRRGKPELALNTDYENNTNRFTINWNLEASLVPQLDYRQNIEINR